MPKLTFPYNRRQRIRVINLSRQARNHEMNAVGRIMERLQSLYCNNDEKIEYKDIAAGPYTGISSPTQSRLVERPAIALGSQLNRFKHLSNGVCFR